MGAGQSNNSGSKVISEHDRAVADLKSQMARLDRFQKQVRRKSSPLTLIRASVCSNTVHYVFF